MVFPRPGHFENMQMYGHFLCGRSGQTNSRYWTPLVDQSSVRLLFPHFLYIHIIGTLSVLLPYFYPHKNPFHQGGQSGNHWFDFVTK
jgi:hypothetical protein